MKKQILNLGKGLSKAEQKQINGGYEGGCDEECPEFYLCHVPSGICRTEVFCQSQWGCE